MGNVAKYAIAFAFISIILRLVFYTTGISLDYPLSSGMTYLMCMLLAVYAALHFEKKDQVANQINVPFFTDIKLAMKAASIFALIVSLYTYLHYTQIDPTFFDAKLAAVVEATQNADLDEMVANNPNLRGKTKEEIIESGKAFSEFMFNPFNHATMTLFFFLMIGGIYSAFMTFIFRKLLIKN